MEWGYGGENPRGRKEIYFLECGVSMNTNFQQPLQFLFLVPLLAVIIYMLVSDNNGRG